MSTANGLAAIGLIAGLILGHPLPAHGSDEKSGTHWLRMCTSPETYGQIECANYVRALVEYDELRGTALKQKRFICVANGVTIGRSRDVVVQALRARPQDLHLPFVLLAHQALEAAFPCAGDPGRGDAKLPTSK